MELHRAKRRLLESSVESEFVSQAKRHNIWAIKIIPFGIRGFPDRLCLRRPGWCFFVELKRPGEKLKLLQKHQAEMLVAFGFEVFMLDTKGKVKEFFDGLQ